MDKGLIFDYEQTLLGKRLPVLNSYFCYTSAQNEALALEIFRYAFETYLKWSPEEIRDYISWDVINLLGLDQVAKYIVFPPELDPEKDLFCFVWKMYPQKFDISQTDLIINVYQNLLDQKISKFPKEFFTGIYGIVRACVCLKYMVEQFLTFKNVEELYTYFASSSVVGTLRKYKLLKVSVDLYDTPLDYLHEALPAHQKDEFLYHYFKFLQQYEEAKNCERSE